MIIVPPPIFLALHLALAYPIGKALSKPFSPSQAMVPAMFAFYLFQGIVEHFARQGTYHCYVSMYCIRCIAFVCAIPSSRAMCMSNQQLMALTNISASSLISLFICTYYFISLRDCIGKFRCWPSTDSFWFRSR